MNRFINTSEKIFAEILRNDGLEVYRPSWPDFIVVNPLKKDFYFVELKTTKSPLTKNQRDTIKLLKSLNIPVKVIQMGLFYKSQKSKSPDIYRLIQTEAGTLYLKYFRV